MQTSPLRFIDAPLSGSAVQPQPSRIDLTLLNSGGGEFAVQYEAAATGRVMFPFPAAEVSSLRFDGEAKVRTARFIDANSQRSDVSAVGQRVRVEYRSGGDGDDAKVRTLTGRLVRQDAQDVVVATTDGDDDDDGGASLVTLRAALVESVAELGASGGPELELQLEEGSEGKALTVRGSDPSMRYYIHNAVTLEPDAAAAAAAKGATLVSADVGAAKEDSAAAVANYGSAPATLVVSAGVNNAYPWSVRVDSLTLTEYAPSVPSEGYLKRAAEATTKMVVAVAETQSDGGAPRLDNSGSLRVYGGSVELGRAGRGPTVVVLARRALPDAKMHYLATIDPTEDAAKPPGSKKPLTAVVRLHPKLQQDEFIPSGGTSVLLDMDPAPGAARLAPVDLRLGFYYDAWNTENRDRMYYRLGTTNLVTLCVEEEATTPDDVANDRENRYSVDRRLVFRNSTPYPAVVKVWLSGRNILTQSTLQAHENLLGARLSADYRRENKDDVKLANAHTLQVVVPGNSVNGGSVCVLRIEYSRV